MSYDSSRQAGTEPEEIEITPEMIEAGIAALFAWSGEFDFERLQKSEIAGLVEDVVLASLRAR